MFDCFYSDLSVELPFTLTHPKPVESPPPTRQASIVPLDRPEDVPVPIEADLIQLDDGYVRFGVGCVQ